MTSGIQPVHNAIIIGAGVSGIAAAAALSRNQVPFICVERSAGVGGIWQPEADLHASPAYANLRLNTSKATTGFQARPLPDLYPTHPTRSQFGDYLAMVSRTHTRNRDLELNTEVTAVRPTPEGLWEVDTRTPTGHQRRLFRHVIAATGRDHTPHYPDIPGLDEFQGRALHAWNYATPHEFAGQRVAVIGLGASGADIAVDVSTTATTTLLSIRRGVHIVPRTLWGQPINEIADADWWAKLTLRQQQQCVADELHYLRGTLADYGLPEPDHRVFERSMTISDDLLPQVKAGHIHPRPAIDHVDARGPVYTDGTRDEVDVLIHCTGYDLALPYLDHNLLFDAQGRVRLYHRVAAPRHHGLYCIGLVKTFGSATRSIEAQAEWAADLIIGRRTLPEPETMDAEIDEHLAGTAGYGARAVDSVQIHPARYLAALRTHLAR